MQKFLEAPEHVYDSPDPDDQRRLTAYYLAAEADARIAELELASKENARYSREMREEFERRAVRIAELEQQLRDAIHDRDTAHAELVHLQNTP